MKIRFTYLLLLLLLPSLAVADNGQGNDLGLRVSDVVILGENNQEKVNATISGKSGWNYSLVVNTTPQVLVERGDNVTLAAGATVLTSGKINKDGEAAVQVSLPLTGSTKFYLQAFAAKKSNGMKGNVLSPLATVISLSGLLSGTQGQKGDKGDKGDTGAVGPTGAEGPIGPQGEVGAQGPTGETGATGPQGATGLTGSQGPKGDTGEKGAEGPQGLKGDKGETGNTGLTGEQGPVGPQGATGPTGLQGPKGDTGAAGADGSQGIKGDKGDIGSIGPTGLQGAKGDTGEQGPKGDKGDIGPAGPQGEAGVAPELKCPAGWIDLGPTCLQPTFGQGSIEDAVNDCYQKGARVCEHQDLAFACSNRENLNIAFPDDTLFFTGSVMLRALNSNTNYVAYTVYRRVGSRCYGPNTINPNDGVVSYELSNAVRSYACCANRTY